MNFLMKKKLSWNEEKRPEVDVLEIVGMLFLSLPVREKAFGIS